MQSGREGKFNVTKLLKKPNYKKANLPKVIDKIVHLSQNQRMELLQVLLKHDSIYKGKRGEWKWEEVHIKLTENMKPFYGWPYSILLKQVEATKEKVYHQCSIGGENDQWAFPGFGIPKKNGKICLLIDFWKINLQIVQSKYPLSIMEELLRSIFGFVYAMKLDMNMGYMSMPSDKYSRNILILIMPFG